MKLEELLGKYLRLRAELSKAYEAGDSNTEHLNRLGDDIVDTERALARAQQVDEQTCDRLPGLQYL